MAEGDYPQRWRRLGITQLEEAETTMMHVQKQGLIDHDNNINPLGRLWLLTLFGCSLRDGQASELFKIMQLMLTEWDQAHGSHQD